MKRQAREHWLVLAAYCALALCLSFPLVLHLADSIPGIPGDVWSYVWAMGWARQGIENGINPFRNDYIYYPLGGATQLLWATSLPSFVSLPLQYALGLVPAFNILYLVASVLTGYGTYLLALECLPERRSAGWAAFLAGAVFAFNPLRLGYGLAFTNLFHTELIPFYALFLLRATRSGTRRDAMLGGFLLGLNAYIDFQIAAFLVLFTAIVAAGFFWRVARSEGGHWHAFFRRLAPLGVITLVGFLVAAPLLSVVAQDMAAEGGNYIRVYPLRYSQTRSYDLLSYLLPNARSTLYQALPVPRVPGVNAAVSVDGESQLSPDRQSFLGLTLLALAFAGAFARPRSFALWIATALLFGLLSFGPTLHVAGHDLGVPLPYALLHEIPLANHIRIPMRYGLMTFLGMALLAGAGVQALGARLRPSILSVTATGLVLAEAAGLPYPTLPWQVPPIYQQIAAASGDFAVLEIPSLNWRDAAAAEAFQTVHRKRILRAYTNRIAPDIADYFGLRQTPLVTRSLRILEGVEDGILDADAQAEDRAAADQVIRFFNLRYAILHYDLLDRGDRGIYIEEYLLKGIMGGRELYRDATVVAFEFPDPGPEPNPLQVDLTSNLGLLHLGRGWQIEPQADVDGERGRYLSGGASEFLFRGHCEPPNDHTPSACGDELRLRAYCENEAAVLQWQLDGRPLPAIKLQSGWANYTLSLAGAAAAPGMHTLTFERPPGDPGIAISKIEIR